MNSFQLKYHKCSVLIAALVAVPAIGALMMLIILFCLPIYVPLWAISLLIISFLFMMILALVWVVQTQIFVPCHVDIDSKGIKFTLGNDSLFYGKRSFYSTWADVYSIEEKFSNQNGDYYYAVGFREPFFKANFSMKENFEDDAEAFFKQLRFFQDNQTFSNQSVDNRYPKIRHNVYATN